MGLLIQGGVANSAPRKHIIKEDISGREKQQGTASFQILLQESEIISFPGNLCQ